MSIKSKTMTSTSSTQKLSSLRSSRTFFVLLIFVSVSILSDNAKLKSLASTNNATITAAAIEQNDYFSLCGRKLYTKDMPQIIDSKDNVQYGITNWERSLDNAILLDYRPEKIHGRTGNQIRGFFHAFDYARDQGGPLVIRDTGFPMDSTLRKLYLGLNHKDLEEKLGLIMYDNVDQKYRDKMYLFGTRWARDYVSTNEAYTQFDIIQHRHYLIQQLYKMTSKEMELHPESSGTKDMCASYHAIFGKHHNGNGPHASNNNGEGTLNGKEITQKYTIIHSRSFEGKNFLEEAHRHYGVDPRASLDYPPDLISAILQPLGMTNHSILMITDGQDKDVANRLSADPNIGPQFQVVPQSLSTMAGDIMLGILSDVFIGNPASSFSQYITMVRYALGFDKSYLYVRKHPLSGKWETFCDDESCFYQLHDLEAQTHQPGARKTLP